MLDRLPTELKLRILEFLLTCPSPIEVWYSRPFCGKKEMEGLLRVRNQELLLLSLEACQYCTTPSVTAWLHTELILLQTTSSTRS